MRQPVEDIKLSLMKLFMQGIVKQVDMGDDPLWAISAINGLQKPTLKPIENTVEETLVQDIEQDVPVQMPKTNMEGKIAKDHAALFAKKAEAHMDWMASQRVKALDKIQSSPLLPLASRLQSRRQEKSRDKSQGQGSVAVKPATPRTKM